MNGGCKAMGIGLVWRRKLTRTGIWLPLFPDLHGNVPLCSNIKVFTGSFAPETAIAQAGSMEMKMG